MPCQRFFQVGKCIAGNTKRCRFDVVGELVESERLIFERELINTVVKLEKMETHSLEYSRILQSCSCLNISFKIMPVFNATSSFSYPASAAKMTSGFPERYSTVGHREPICRRRRLLKIWTTSFLASNSNRGMFWTSTKSRSVLYVSCASWAISSGAGSLNFPKGKNHGWVKG